MQKIDGIQGVYVEDNRLEKKTRAKKAMDTVLRVITPQKRFAQKDVIKKEWEVSRTGLSLDEYIEERYFVLKQPSRELVKRFKQK